jgi:hypothetical protein
MGRRCHQAAGWTMERSWFDLWQAAPTRGRRSWYKLHRPGGLKRHQQLKYVAYLFVFLGSIRCNSVVICRADGTCGQRSSVLPRSLLCFLTFRLAGTPWLGGPDKVFSPGSNPLAAFLVTGTNISSSKHLGVFWGPPSLIEYQGPFTRR